MRLRRRHIAGVIPIAGHEDTIDVPWSDCMMPVAHNMLAIERAVLECAYAGCKTIWIVCNDDMAPLIKERTGEYVFDPVYHYRKERWSHEMRRVIPIFYVPIHAKDLNKRDCLAWSILYGSVTAFKIGKTLSGWVAPHRYYVSFPQGVYDPSLVREHRNLVKKQEVFAFSHNGKTFKDNRYLGFTFGKDEWLEMRRVIRSGTGAFTSDDLKDGQYPRTLLPLKERYSARHFTLDKVTEPVNIDNIQEIQDYHSIEDWESYVQYMASGKVLDCNVSYLTRGKKLNKMCLDSEEIDEQPQN